MDGDDCKEAIQFLYSKYDNSPENEMLGRLRRYSHKVCLEPWKEIPSLDQGPADGLEVQIKVDRWGMILDAKAI